MLQFLGLIKKHFLILKVTNSSVIACISAFGGCNVDTGIGQGVREFIDDSLTCIIASQRAFARSDIVVQCGKDLHNERTWIKWQELLETPVIVCVHHDDNLPHDVTAAQIIRNWTVMKV